MMHGPQTPSHSPFSNSPHAPFVFQSRRTEQRNSATTSTPRHHHHQFYFQQDQQPTSSFSPSYPMAVGSPASSSSSRRSIPPHIAVQKPSEPASPATIATTLSSHSTPSPSPARVAIISDHSTAPTDFTLFDEALMAASQEMLPKTSSPQDNFSHDNGQYLTAGFPMIVPQDQYANYTPTTAGMYGPYADSSSHLFERRQQQQPPPRQQRLLRPQYSGYSNSGLSSQMDVGHEHPKLEEDDLPALSPVPNRARFPSSARLSVSSVDTFRSPTTPGRSPGPTDDGALANHLPNTIPKLGRTYSDAIQDELYHPDLMPTSEFSPQTSQPVPQMGVFPGIYLEAQQQHQRDLSRGSPRRHIDNGRDNSPFRANSPYFATAGYSQAFGEQGQQQPDASMLQTGMKKEQQDSGTPKTISPRDALLEYSEPEGDVSHMSLFGPCPSNGTHSDSSSRRSLASLSREGSELDDLHSMATSRRDSNATSTASSHVYTFPDMQFPAGSQQQPPYLMDLSQTVQSNYVSGTPSVGSSSYSGETIMEKPAHTKADSGTYTCTYSGCGLRFTTPSKLQKHRRESHRKSSPAANSVSTAAAIASRNAQPGPHRCMRPNPSTGKPCNTVFSRPYDLTRHEDTIHNVRKEKVRCEICTDEKTFSRPDALVRHRRVKHGIH